MAVSFGQTGVGLQPFRGKGGRQYNTGSNNPSLRNRRTNNFLGGTNSSSGSALNLDALSYGDFDQQAATDELAQSQGYSRQYDGSYFRSSGARPNTPGSRLGSSVDASYFSGQTTPTLLGQFDKALFDDMENQQQEADRMFSELGGAIGSFEGALTQNVEDIRGQAVESSETLNQYASDLDAQGDSFYGDIFKQVAKADELAAQATETQEGVLEGYDDQVAGLAASQAKGLHRSAQSQMQYINAGVGQGGRRMSAAEQSDAARDLRFKTRDQIAGSLLPLFHQSAQIKAQLGSMVAQSQQGQAQTALGGAGALIGAQAQRTALGNISSTLRQYSEGLMQAGVASAAQYELAGYQSLFQLIQNNPKGIVSLAEGISASLSAKMIPYAGSIRAIDI